MAAEVPDEGLAGQDGGADPADGEEEDSDGVKVGRDQSEYADDQPCRDDQGYCSYVAAAHINPMHLWQSVMPVARVPGVLRRYT
jgi:hypothetical protein